MNLNKNGRGGIAEGNGDSGSEVGKGRQAGPGVVERVGGYGAVCFCSHEKNGYSDVRMCMGPIYD